MAAVTLTGTLAGKGGSTQVTASCLVGAAGFIGATTFAPGYPAAGGDEVKAASIFDGYTGLKLAGTIQKRYLAEGQWLTSVPKSWAQLTAAGCRFWLCVKPLRTGVGSPAIAASERANLAATVKLLKPYGLVLWNEYDDPDSSGVYWFGGAQPT